MVAYSGSFVAASTAAAAFAIRTQMQTTIPSHTNWTLVESTTVNSSTFACDVYKCSSAGNGLGVDFYVAVIQNGLGGLGSNLYLGLAEGYNTSTHKPKRAAVHAPVALNTLQADGGFMPATTEIDWYNGTYNPGGGTGSAYSVSGTNPIYGSAAFIVDDYKIMVAADGVFFCARASLVAAYAGVYDSLVPTPGTNDPVPLCVWNAYSSNAGGVYSASTRHPLGGGASIGYACNLNGTSASENASNPFGIQYANPSPMGTLGNGTTADNQDLYAGGNATAVSRYVALSSYVSASTTVGRDKNGWVRGFYKRIRQATTVAGLTWGDTIQIDSISYTLAYGTNTFVESNPA